MPVISCLVCMKGFFVSASRVDAGRGRYCSRSCHQLALQASRKYSSSKPCPQCGAPVLKRERRAMYCSRTCAAKALQDKSEHTKYCLQCSNPFITFSKKELFCSRLCEAKNKIAKGDLCLMPDPWENDVSLTQYTHQDCWRCPDPVLGF